MLGRAHHAVLVESRQSVAATASTAASTASDVTGTESAVFQRPFARGNDVVVVGEHVVPAVVRGIRWPDAGVVVREDRGGRRRRTSARVFVTALFLLHPSVLEPYLDLPLGEVQLGRHLLAFVPDDVLGRLEHRFQHGRLVFGVRLSGPLVAA